jgi:hypothetical protein
MLGIHVEVSLSSSAIATSGHNTEKVLTQSPSSSFSNQTANTLDTKKLKIALLTDALFSDAGWVPSGIMPHKH